MKATATQFQLEPEYPVPTPAGIDLPKTVSSGILDQIHCMDFLQAGRLLDGLQFDLVIADPPYNIGKSFGTDRNDAPLQDNMPLQDYLEWTDRWLSLCMEYLSETGVAYIYGFPEILAHVAVRYPLDRQRWLVWHYTNKTVPGLKFWQRSHESILCLWKSKRPALNIDPIREGYTENYKRAIGKTRKQTPGRFSRGTAATRYNGHENGALPRDVIKIPALAGGAGRSERWFLCRDCGEQIYPPEELPKHEKHDTLKHPTQKPLQLTRRLMLSRVTENSGRVLIPFAGSGSECVAAQTLGLQFFACELNPQYVSFGRQWLDWVPGE